MYFSSYISKNDNASFYSDTNSCQKIIEKVDNISAKKVKKIDESLGALPTEPYFFRTMADGILSQDGAAIGFAAILKSLVVCSD